MAHVWFTLGFILYFHLVFINGSVNGPWLIFCFPISIWLLIRDNELSNIENFADDTTVQVKVPYLLD